MTFFRSKTDKILSIITFFLVVVWVALCILLSFKIIPQKVLDWYAVPYCAYLTFYIGLGIRDFIERRKERNALYESWRFENEPLPEIGIVPRGFTFFGPTFKIADHCYRTTIHSLFHAYTQQKRKLKVLNVQVIYHPNKLHKYQIIAFVLIDEAANYLSKASLLMDAQMGDLYSADCDHDYDSNLKCTKCGKKM